MDNFRQRLDEVQLRLERSIQTNFEHNKLTLAHLTQSLHSLSPMAVLKRGYAIVTREEDGQVVKGTSQVAVDEIYTSESAREACPLGLPRLIQEVPDARKETK